MSTHGRILQKEYFQETLIGTRKNSCHIYKMVVNMRLILSKKRMLYFMHI